MITKYPTKKPTHSMYRGKRARTFPIPLDKGARGIQMSLAERTFYDVCSPQYEKGEAHGQPSGHALQPSSTGN